MISFKINFSANIDHICSVSKYSGHQQVNKGVTGGRSNSLNLFFSALVCLFGASLMEKCTFFNTPLEHTVNPKNALPVSEVLGLEARPSKVAHLQQRADSEETKGFFLLN